MPDQKLILKTQDYLRQFGYIDSPIVEAFGFSHSKAFVPAIEQPGTLDARTRMALLKFQENFGLPMTGEIDEATLSFWERPRCGFPDVGQFVLQGNKWPVSELAYSFLELTSDLPVGQAKDAISEALALWSNAANIRFNQAKDGNQLADIRIRFVNGEHGDGFAFDGPGNVLAHAFFPPPNGADLAGDCHFDDGESWSQIDLVTVAAHEFGHALGLAHSTTLGALMYPYYSGPQRFLHADDIGGIQALYGAKTVTPPPPPDDDVSDRLAANLRDRVYTARKTGRKGPWGGDAAEVYGQDGTKVDLTLGIEVF